MNDTELDEMLNQWDAPPVRAAWREGVCAGLIPRRSRARWFPAFMPGVGKGLFAGVAAGAVACLLLISQAFPQSLGLNLPASRIPYLVEYQTIRYADDGLPSVDGHAFGYKYKGMEIVVAYDGPGFDGLRRQIVATLQRLMLRVAPSLVLPAESSGRDAAAREYVNSGCNITYFREAVVIGHETILDHPTTVIRISFHEQGKSEHGKMTMWEAPDLGCFTLKSIREEMRPDGTFRPVAERRPLKVIQ